MKPECALNRSEFTNKTTTCILNGNTFEINLNDGFNIESTKTYSLEIKNINNPNTKDISSLDFKITSYFIKNDYNKKICSFTTKAPSVITNLVTNCILYIS